MLSGDQFKVCCEDENYFNGSTCVSNPIQGENNFIENCQ